MKAGKMLILLVLLIGGVIAYTKFVQTPVGDGVAAEQEEKQPIRDEDKPRVEEKYGFTSEPFNP